MNRPTRVSRRPRSEQLRIALRLAVLRGAFRAAHSTRGPMGARKETYWVADGNWWIVPPRTETTILRANAWAVDRVLDRAEANQEFWVEIFLRRLERAGMRAVARMQRLET